MSGLSGTFCLSEYSPGQDLILGENKLPIFNTKEECLKILTKLYRDEELITILEADENTFTDYFATPGAEHMYCLEAINECGVSAQSCNPGSLLTQPDIVEYVNASDGTYAIA